MSDSKTTYVVGIFAHWGTLTPPLQHSLAGDGVMEYQFEPLVRMGEKGVMEPLSAKSWEFSADRRILRFKIDISRRFSDGSYLCAEDFKRSWEDGLRLEPKSSNSSLADGLGNLRGYSQFKKTGEIEGIRVIGKDELELDFEKPVRIALVHLSGGRFSVYKMVKNHPIGTGPYVIAEKDQTLSLVPNSYYAGHLPKLKNIKILVVNPEVAAEKLKSGEIDAYLFAETANLSGCDEGKLGPIRCVNGQEASHVIIELNGLTGHFFSDPKHRLAFQALVLKNIDLAENAFRVRGFMRDTQSFLKFQAGRIPDAEAQAIISSGDKYIKRLIAATQKHPLYLAASARGWQWLIDFLREQGLNLTESSRVDFELKEVLNMFYKNPVPDIMAMTASVADGDPDGLYHLLGRNGAIFSPMAERKAVCDGMEHGRQLLDLSQLPAHYEEVSRKILEEVPYIHLGYFSRRIAYNSDRLKGNETLLGRNSLNIMALEPK